MKRLSLTILLAVSACAAVFLFVRYNTYKRPNVKLQTVITIAAESNYEALLDSLLASDALKNPGTFMKAAQKRNLQDHFEPGSYLLKPGMSNQYIIRMIANKWESPISITLTGYIKTLDGLAAFLGNRFEADSADFAAILHNKAFADSLGFTPQTLIGMFIPNTYEFYWTTSPRDVILRFHKEYEAFWDGGRDKKARAMKMSRNQVMTLASIVIGETNNLEEMPLIAGVYINRLNRGMRLQACPTVIYAHLETEPGLTRLYERHLQIESPYNTYKYKGLPPGPIAIPTIAAIDAVLNYKKTNYLYFCANPELNGSHKFSSSYSEHRANSRAYNKAIVEREKSRKASRAV